MPRFSIFGYYGQGNAGDEAILAALTDGIRAEFKDPIIGVYTANIQETEKSHNVKGYRFFGLDIKSIIVGLLGRSRSIYIKSVLHFLRTDVVVIGGGGLFFDSVETNEWIYGYINMIHRAKRFGKKVALVGISVGPLHHKDSRHAIGDAFGKVDLICVRDHQSRELLMECGISEERINVVPDLVFTLTPAPEYRITEILTQEKFPLDGRKNIVLTPCCYNVEKQGWVQKYVEFCEKVVHELDANLWFIPMQRSNSHDDLTAINRILGSLSQKAQSKTSVLKGMYSAGEIQGVIGRGDFALAERLHGSIMAINSGVPLLSIAYMPKVDGVLILANMKESIIQMREFIDGSRSDFLLKTVKDNLDNKISFTSKSSSLVTLARLSFSKMAALVDQR